MKINKKALMKTILILIVMGIVVGLCIKFPMILFGIVAGASLMILGGIIYSFLNPD